MKYLVSIVHDLPKDMSESKRKIHETYKYISPTFNQQSFIREEGQQAKLIDVLDSSREYLENYVKLSFGMLITDKKTAHRYETREEAERVVDFMKIFMEHEFTIEEEV